MIWNAAKTPYRLRGGGGDTEYLLELSSGEQTVGSSRESTFILPDSSVSRVHARLSLIEDTLILQDLGSTNGTFVDGERVERICLEPGMEIRLGRVSLRLEETGEGDTGLAIDLFDEDGQPDRPMANAALSSWMEPDPSTLACDPFQSGFWTEQIEMVLNALASSAGGLDLALTGLGESLELQGCCLVQWLDESEPVVAVAWGTLGRIPRQEEVSAGAESGNGPGVEIAHLPGSPAGCIALAWAPGRRPVGLILWGGSGLPSTSRRGFRILVRLLAWTQWARETPATEEAPVVVNRRLQFPSSYRAGTSPRMLELYNRMRRLRDGDLPVLIHGETGSGKELIARALHASSRRRGGPFVAINCAAIPRDLLESELFGIARGVATGVEPRRGKFELASGGTLFLDELGEMAIELQPKLLRALQESEIQPLGGKPRPIDVRVLSATNVPLEPASANSRLRPDLYFRLAGFVLDVPALRQCSEDIPGLIEHFLRRFSQEYGVPVRGLGMGALRRLVAYSWPGNVRELENQVRRMVLLARPGQVLHEGTLPGHMRESRAISQELETWSISLAQAGSLHLSTAVGQLEEAFIRAALERSAGVKKEACHLLGISRNGLDKKLKRLGIDLEKPGSAATKDE